MSGVLTPAADGVLRDAAFRKLLASRLFAATAVQIQSAVVDWQLYDMIHCALTLGWVGLAQFLPMAALVLPAGSTK